MSELGLKRRHDPGFGQSFAWDIDLLSGYDSEFLDVRSRSSQDSFSWLKLNPGFGRILMDRGARALWVQGWQVAAYWQAVLEAKRLGLEVWLRGETNLRSNRGGILKRTALKRLFKRVDQFLSIGEANRRFYLARGVGEDRITDAPYCVDNARFSSQAEFLMPSRQMLRRNWSIPDEAFCFLFMGKLIPKKRPGDLVAAVTRLQKKGMRQPLHILFAGTGELDRDLRQSCMTVFDQAGRRIGVEGAGPTASFVGFLNQTEVSKAYVAADCLVLPSDSSETWGLVVNEAMASGLPCVTSNACGCVEDLILPLRPELSYPVGDIASLEMSLEAVIANPPSRPLLTNHIENNNVLHTALAAEQLYSRLTC
jgi:glycosyltransferase involved in cell wall biosynthesis